MKFSLVTCRNWLSVSLVLASGLITPVTGAEPRPGGAAPLQMQYSSARGAAAGIRIVSVGLSVNGSMVDLRYGITDLEKARKVLNPKSRILLQDEASGKLFAIADMAKIGKLRSLPWVDPNRGYVMVFKNAGRFIKAGDMVSLIIDDLRIEGLVVR